MQAALQECAIRNVVGVHARAEDLAGRGGDAFAVVVARAVAPLQSLVELSSPLLFEGGRLVALKGVLSDDEAQAAEAVGRIVGCAAVSRREFALPGDGVRRTIVVYEKVGRSSISLPRRVGLAQRRPLA